MEALSPEEFPNLSAAEPLIDWSPGPEADRLTIELLVGGLEALADRRRRGTGAREVRGSTMGKSNPNSG